MQIAYAIASLAISPTGPKQLLWKNNGDYLQSSRVLREGRSTSPKDALEAFR
jgi:hypothetical protein